MQGTNKGLLRGSIGSVVAACFVVGAIGWAAPQAAEPQAASAPAAVRSQSAAAPLAVRRPDRATYERLITSIESALDKDAPMPGRPAIFHWLNRAEYGNAVRDLLALDLDVAALQPPDDSASMRSTPMGYGAAPGDGGIEHPLPGGRRRGHVGPQLAGQDAAGPGDGPEGSKWGAAIPKTPSQPFVS
jgi:hypothetical protein